MINYELPDSFAKPTPGFLKALRASTANIAGAGAGAGGGMLALDLVAPGLGIAITFGATVIASITGDLFTLNGPNSVRTLGQQAQQFRAGVLADCLRFLAAAEPDAQKQERLYELALSLLEQRNQEELIRRFPNLSAQNFRRPEHWSAQLFTLFEWLEADYDDKLQAIAREVVNALEASGGFTPLLQALDSLNRDATTNQYMTQILAHHQQLIDGWMYSPLFDEDFALHMVEVPVVGMSAENGVTALVPDCLEHVHNVLPKGPLSGPALPITMMLTGGPGTGKSTLARSLAFDLLTEHIDPARAVIFFPLQNFDAVSGRQNIDSLAGITRNLNLLMDEKVGDALSRGGIGRLVLILDGLDELGEPQGRSNRRVMGALAEILPTIVDKFHDIQITFVLAGRPSAATQVLDLLPLSSLGFTQTLELWRIGPPPRQDLANAFDDTPLATYRDLVGPAHGTMVSGSAQAQQLDYRGMWLNAYLEALGYPAPTAEDEDDLSAIEFDFFDEWDSAYCDISGEPLTLYLIVRAILDNNSQVNAPTTREWLISQIFDVFTQAHAMSRSAIYEVLLNQAYNADHRHQVWLMDMGFEPDNVFKRLFPADKSGFEDYVLLLSLFAAGTIQDGSFRTTLLNHVAEIADDCALTEEFETLIEFNDELQGVRLLNVFYWSSRKVTPLRKAKGKLVEFSDEQVEFTHKSFAEYLIARAMVCWGRGQRSVFDGSDSDDGSGQMPELGSQAENIANFLSDIIASTDHGQDSKLFNTLHHPDAASQARLTLWQGGVDKEGFMQCAEEAEQYSLHTLSKILFLALNAHELPGALRLASQTDDLFPVDESFLSFAHEEFTNFFLKNLHIRGVVFTNDDRMLLENVRLSSVSVIEQYISEPWINVRVDGNSQLARTTFATLDFEDVTFTDSTFNDCDFSPMIDATVLLFDRCSVLTSTLSYQLYHRMIENGVAIDQGANRVSMAAHDFDRVKDRFPPQNEPGEQ